MSTFDADHRGLRDSTGHCINTSCNESVPILDLRLLTCTVHGGRGLGTQAEQSSLRKLTSPHVWVLTLHVELRTKVSQRAQQSCTPQRRSLNHFHPLLTACLAVQLADLWGVAWRSGPPTAMKRRAETHTLAGLCRPAQPMLQVPFALLLLLASGSIVVLAYRVDDPRVVDDVSDPPYFEPDAAGFTGIRSLPQNPEHTRVNEGNQFQSSQPNIFAGVRPRRESDV